MNPRTPLPADHDDFDSAPEKDLTTLFAASVPPVRPVDVDSVFAKAVVNPSFHSRNHTLNRRSPMFRRIAVLASAAVGVVAIVVLFVLFGSGTQLTFAQVAERVAKTRSMTMKLTGAASDKSLRVDRASCLADGRCRIDMADGNYTITDTDGNALCVSPGEKRAVLMQGLGTPSINLYEVFRNIVGEKSERLPDETLAGRTTKVLRAELDERLRKQSPTPVPPVKVWVDAETQLPVRVESIPTSKSQPKWAAYDIVFDPPVDASHFSLTPPEGYTVTKQGMPATWQNDPPAKKELLALEVIPGVGLGPVKFGMSKEEVFKLLGKPDMEEAGSLQYSSRGYACSISPSRGLLLVSFFSQQECAFKVRDFAGKTKEGIGIGSSLKDLEKAFGKPTAVEHTDQPGATGTYVRYSKLGLEFTLFYDKVVGFMMQPVR
jgi:hypothetical protein